MKSSPHLLLALSGHGYGHLAQCAPVINALWKQCPALRLTVGSLLPRAVIAGRLDSDFTSLAIGMDVVLPMFSAWEVDIPAACQAWSSFHQDYDAGLQQDVELLRELKPDLILANIPYRILSAARVAGVPAVALCSLDWASIYAAYCNSESESKTILETMWSGYRAADIFLAPEPALEMPGLENYRGIGPIARQGARQKATLLEQLGLSQGTRIVMVALGGIATTLHLDNWPCMDRVAWLFAAKPDSVRDDMFDFSSLSMSFIDVLASSDAVLTKPGYGTYAEAVCNGVPLLSLAREDWPETPYLDAWARRHGCIETISETQFERGQFASALEHVWSLPASTARPEPEGVPQAVEVLLDYL